MVVLLLSKLGIFMPTDVSGFPSFKMTSLLDNGKRE